MVVLVHGFPIDHAMWDAQVEALSRRCRVLAVDLRGFGRSEATDAPATMEQFADDLAGLLDALGVREPIVLGGLSMGGYVCFAFWRKYAARLRALVLCDTRAEADSPEAAAARRATALRVLDSGPGVLVDEMAAEALRRKPRCASGPNWSRHCAAWPTAATLGAWPPRRWAWRRGPTRRPSSAKSAARRSSWSAKRTPSRRRSRCAGWPRRSPARGSSRFPPPVTSRRWNSPRGSTRPSRRLAEL